MWSAIVWEETGNKMVAAGIQSNSLSNFCCCWGRGAEITSCCGSFVPYGDSVACQPFMRLVSAPSFATTNGPAPGRDVYPPGRIVDLRVERVLNATNEVELGWTAPGADLDAGGAAARYEIRCYTDRSRLDDSTSAIVVPASMAPTPGPPGLWQRTPVAVPWPNQVFYYAVAAVDAAGNRGRVSNIVSVYIYEPPPPPTTAPAILAADVNDSHGQSFSSHRLFSAAPCHALEKSILLTAKKTELELNPRLSQSFWMALYTFSWVRHFFWFIRFANNEYWTINVMIAYNLEK